MYFTPQDLVKLGALFLHHGRSLEGKQIVSKEWVEESLKFHSKWYGTEGFGYYWWLSKFSGEFIYSARGYGGQLILNIPRLKICIVTTANWHVSPLKSNKHLDKISELILIDLLTFLEPDISNLFKAAALGDFNRVKFALDSGISPDLPTKVFNTPLMAAAFHGHLDVGKATFRFWCKLKSEKSSRNDSISCGSLGRFKGSVAVFSGKRC